MHPIVPVLVCAFLVAMALEWRVALVRGVRLASGRQLASDLACGLLRVVVDALGKGSLLLAYAGVHAALAPVEWDATHPLAWAAALLGYDFLYYWSHRLSHRVGFLWANHAVHHQTRDYHLAIGFRAGVLGPLLALPFFVPLAVAGVPPVLYAAVALVHGALMFGLHARFVGDGGRLGLVFNTPSHHRVHHSVAAEHLGANFGGLLIVWDRWFGTFAPERRVGPAVEYGLPEGTRHLDPIAAQLWGWQQLGRQMEGRGVRGALAALVSIGSAASARDAVRPSKRQRAVVGAAVVTTALAPFWLQTTASAALLALPVALLVADLASGLVHWFFDRHVAPSSRWLGRIAHDFHDHHVRPQRTLEIGFAVSAYRAALLATLPLFASAALVPQPHAAAFLFWLGAISLVAPQLHKLSHQPRPARAVRVLQRARLILGRRHHARHHGRGHDRAYCIVTGWCNPILDRLGLWRRLDAALAWRRG